MESGRGYQVGFNPFNAQRSAGFGVRILCQHSDFLELILPMGLTMQTPNRTPNGWETHFNWTTILVLQNV